MDTTAKRLSFFYNSNKDLYTKDIVYTLPKSTTDYPEWCLEYKRKEITTAIFDNSKK